MLSIKNLWILSQPLPLSNACVFAKRFPMGEFFRPKMVRFTSNVMNGINKNDSESLNNDINNSSIDQLILDLLEKSALSKADEGAVLDYESLYFTEVTKVVNSYKILMLSALQQKDENRLLSLQIECEKELENLSNLELNPGLKVSNNFVGSLPTDTIKLTHKKTIERSSLFSKVLKEVLHKKSIRKRKDQTDYVICSMILSRMSDTQLAVSLITGLNRTFSKYDTKQKHTKITLGYLVDYYMWLIFFCYFIN